MFRSKTKTKSSQPNFDKKRTSLASNRDHMSKAMSKLNQGDPFEYEDVNDGFIDTNCWNRLLRKVDVLGEGVGLRVYGDRRINSRWGGYCSLCLIFALFVMLYFFLWVKFFNHDDPQIEYRTSPLGIDFKADLYTNQMYIMIFIYDWEDEKYLPLEFINKNFALSAYLGIHTTGDFIDHTLVPCKDVNWHSQALTNEHLTNIT